MHDTAFPGLRAALLLGLALALLQAPAAAQPATPKPAAAPTLLDEAERLARSAETWEMKGTGAFGDSEAEALIPRLEQANARLAAHLRSHPDDVPALLLQARVLRGLILVTPVAIKLDDQGGGRITSGDRTSARAGALAALDKVLALDPGNGAAFYWKARTLSLVTQGAAEVGAERAHDPRPAIEAARRAVNAAPANPDYREYLAIMLFARGEQAEARQHLTRLPGKHPILQLMEDQEAIPLPPGADADADGKYDLARDIFSGRLDEYRFPGLRVNVLTVPAPHARVREFYAARLPGIQWVQHDKDEPFAAAFAWRGHALVPAADPMPYVDVKEDLPSGLLLVAIPVEDAPATTRLFILNFRRF